MSRSVQNYIALVCFVVGLGILAVVHHQATKYHG